jgi:hypothetical protein
VNADQNNNLAFSFEPTTAAAPESAPKDAPLHTESANARTVNATNLVRAESVAKANLPTSQNVRTPDAQVQANQPAKHPGAQPSREGTEKVLNIEPYREQRATVMPFLTLFALLIVFAALVLAYQKIYPTASEGWVASIPFLGPSVVRNDHLKNSVLLKAVETKFQILQGNREAVVLTGVAVNRNPVMIRNVQLSGQLLDGEGKEIERQTMWIGNAISLQIIRGMTAQDVTDLQRLKPLKTFEIPPGDSVPFAIVFLRPGKSPMDARCEVLSVEAI